MIKSLENSQACNTMYYQKLRKKNVFVNNNPCRRTIQLLQHKLFSQCLQCRSYMHGIYYYLHVYNALPCVYYEGIAHTVRVFPVAYNNQEFVMGTDMIFCFSFFPQIPALRRGDCASSLQHIPTPIWAHPPRGTD